MDKLIVSNAPHIHTSDSSRRVMLDVVIALLPATVAAVVITQLLAGDAAATRPVR